MKTCLDRTHKFSNTAQLLSVSMIPIIGVFVTSCVTRGYDSEASTMAAAECASNNANARRYASIAGLCGCPNGATSCDRTFNVQDAYRDAGQKGCNQNYNQAIKSQAQAKTTAGLTTQMPVASGCDRNWGGGGTAAGGGHEGWDCMANNGTPVYAATEGTVVYVQTGCKIGDRYCGNAWGNFVVIFHGGNLYTRYAHLTPNPEVAIGWKVNKGAKLGTIGSTGASDAPHLHFEVVYATDGWFNVKNPRNGACVVDPGLLIK